MSLRTAATTPKQKSKPSPLPRSRLDEVLRAGVDAGFCGGAPTTDPLGISKFASLSLKTDAGNQGRNQGHDPTWMDFMDDCDEYFREVEGEDDEAREARTQRLLDCMRRAIEKERILQRQNHPPPISPSQRVHMWHAPRVDVKDRRPRWNYRNNPDEYDPEEYEPDYP